MSHSPAPQKKTKAHKREVAKLQRDIRQLQAALGKERRENARLRRRLSSPVVESKAGGSSPRADKKSAKNNPATALMADGASAARRYAAPTFLRYCIQTLKSSTLGLIIRRIAAFFRRLRVVRLVANVVLVLLTAVLASAVFVTVLPFFLLTTVVALLAAILNARSANHRLMVALAGKHIRVVIPHDSTTLGENSFIERSALSMAQEPDTAVIMVSPHALSTRGLGGKGMYFTARQEQTDLYLVRKEYYFILRRKVLKHIDPHMTIIY